MKAAETLRIEGFDGRILLIGAERELPYERPPRGLLEAAQAGDEDAFAQLVDPYRGELTAHCYRMLGSPAS